ncbi:MAG: hypothetical protein ACPGVN_08410 [Alphaproteobacteria bacterium]
MFSDPAINSLIFVVGLLVVVYLVLIVTIALLRRALWLFSGIFFLIDEFMWFAYNPLRFTMKDRERGSNRLGFVVFSLFLVKPIWQLSVWILTTPLRIITALYFDVLMYLFVMLSDSLDELLHPKLGRMRDRKGFDYAWRWLLGMPFRFLWLIFKNALAVIDSVMMLIVSIVWPTFTMYHGTSEDAVFDIKKGNRWLVGGGNFGGSGIYFGRSVKVAQHYARMSSSDPSQERIIIARVTFSMLRNVGTLFSEKRQDVGSMGEAGERLAKALKFPFFATELWRDRKNWWEYCLLHGDKRGQYISSWRIRGVGFAKLKNESQLSGTLERLWGGKAHYCLSIPNIILTVISGGFALWVFNLFT